MIMRGFSPGVRQALWIDIPAALLLTLSTGLTVPFGGGRLFGRLDWRWIFPAAAVLGMAASLAQRRLRLTHGPVTDDAAALGLAGAWAAVRDDRAFRRLLVASFLFGAGCWIQTP